MGLILPRYFSNWLALLRQGSLVAYAILAEKEENGFQM